MRLFEVLHVAKSFYEPIVGIGPGQNRLDGFQYEDKVCYSTCSLLLWRADRSPLTEDFYDSFIVWEIVAIYICA